MQADGTNSLVDFSGLLTVSGAFPITFEASSGGTTLVPRLLGGPNAYLTFNPGGILSAGGIEQLAGLTLNGVTASFPVLSTVTGSITASNVAVGFPALTKFDGAGFSISGGAVVSLPALQNVALGCNANWSVSGDNSILEMPGLRTMIIFYLSGWPKVSTKKPQVATCGGWWLIREIPI